MEELLINSIGEKTLVGLVLIVVAYFLYKWVVRIDIQKEELRIEKDKQIEDIRKEKDKQIEEARMRKDEMMTNVHKEMQGMMENSMKVLHGVQQTLSSSNADIAGEVKALKSKINELLTSIKNK